MFKDNVKRMLWVLGAPSADQLLPGFVTWALDHSSFSLIISKSEMIDSIHMSETALRISEVMCIKHSA